MLNKNNIRELAYIVRIDSIEPIVGSDNCEAAVVGGWRIMTHKGTFNPKDLAIYFEIDSKVPETKPFAFLAAKHYKIKTQKYTFGGKGNFVSQGLLMHPADFGWSVVLKSDDSLVIVDNEGNEHTPDDESRFLTQKLKVTYSVAEDNSRKSKGVDKYARMAQSMGKKASKQPYHWLLKRGWGKKLLYLFYGRKAKRLEWPDWVKKTDEERVENLAWALKSKNPYIATEKIDGTSTTFTMKRGKFGRHKFYVCSRNVVFDTPSKQCYYNTNVYLEMAQKYNIEAVLAEILNSNPELEWATIQGETYGAGIQKRDYGLADHQFAAFNFVTSREGRWNSALAAQFLATYNIPFVPILDDNYILPDTINELREFSHSEGSRIDGKIKEGIVFRSKDGEFSFKCVDPEFLIKYH